MGLLLGIDLGTSYFKVGLFSPDGSLRGLGRVPVEPFTPAPGRVELPVAAFWIRLRRALNTALGQAGAGVGDISGISYSSQANTFVLLDAAGAELTPLVFWNDQRARPLARELAEFGSSDEFRATAGLAEFLPECAPAKCHWFARHEPVVWARARRLMMISDYLTFSLTGESAGDSSTAALTGLYRLATRDWSPSALAVFGLKPEMMATTLAAGTASGRTSARAAGLLGLPAGIPFAVGALDHHAAALGSGLGELADASLSTGTVLAAMVLVDRPVPLPGCIHGPHLEAGRYFRLAFDPNGAGQLEDYQRRRAPGLDIVELLRRAECAADPVASEEPEEHGVAVLGLLRRIAGTQRELLRRVAADAPVNRIAATGGGARSPFWLQVTADTIGLPVVAVASPERACLGAAMLAAPAAGIWPDVRAAARQMVSVPREYRPAGGASR